MRRCAGPVGALSAQYGPAGRTEAHAVAAQAARGATFVGDHIAAQAIGVLLASRTLRRRALRGSARCRRACRKREAEKETASGGPRRQAPLVRQHVTDTHHTIP